MIIVISYILNLLAPIVNTLGVIGFCTCFPYDDFHILWISGVAAIVGFIFGIFAYKNGIPPRWFWSRSADAIFSFSVSAVFGYMINFAMWPTAIYLVQVLVEKCSAA